MEYRRSGLKLYPTQRTHSPLLGSPRQAAPDHCGQTGAYLFCWGGFNYFWQLAWIPTQRGVGDLMGQVSSTLRRVEGGFGHWCPGCNEMHILPKSWNFDGNLERPTFTPSFRHSGIQRVFVNGNWTGEWKRDASGNTVPSICH